jgi:MoaA/NifB/PqqE/SkfB family radical SAM enzyme
MDEKIASLVMWAEGKKAPPLTLELNITNKCNLQCKMCWLRATKPNYEEMDDEELARIIDEAIALGVKEFRFPGSGEPLVRKKILFDIMEKIKENERNGLLISNGTLFSEEDVKRLIEMEWDVLTISLDGPSPEINDYIRGVNGAFKRVMKTLNLIKKWKSKLKKEKPWLRMNTVLTNKNYDKLEGMLILAKKYDFKEVLIQPITIFSKEGEMLKVNNIEEVIKYLKTADEIAKRLKIKTNMNSIAKNIGIIENVNQMEKMIEREIRKFGNSFLASPCFEPFYNLVIMPDGKAGPCAIAGGIAEVNVKESSLKEVWFGKIFEKFRKKLLAGEFFSFCSHCCIPIFLENRRLRRELAKVIW